MSPRFSGAAFNKDGNGQSGMGVDAEDVDGDGLPELFVTNFTNEYSTLYQNFGNGMLLRQHAELRAGVRLDALGQVGLRAGRLRQRRLAGLLLRERARRQQSAPARSAGRLRRDPALVPQRPRQAVSAGHSRRRAVFRYQARRPGAAFGDIDNDGDIDIVVNHKDGAPAVFATIPSPTITGSGSRSRGPRATATPSAPSSRSRPATGRSTASAKGATACRRPTILA